MGKLTKFMFVLFMLICLVVGLPLLLAPGRFLGLFAWAPLDPLISRLLGAALLALSWSAYRGWQSADPRQAVLLLEVYLIFTLLGGLGWLRNLLGSNWWPWIWAICVLLVVMGLVFGWLRLKATPSKS
jgi:hypothetical protein